MTKPISRKMPEELESFLKSFRGKKNQFKYRDKISQIPAHNGKSLTIDFNDVAQFDAELANQLLIEPEEILKALDQGIYETLKIENPTYAEKVRKDLRGRVRDLPDKLTLRNITTDQLDHLISVEGMVVRASELKPMANLAAYRCSKCGHTTTEEQSGLFLKRPSSCESCGDARGLELDEKETEFVDFQLLRMQELPEELPPGQLPQYSDVDLTGDMVNTARPGDRVVVTGIVKAEVEYAVAAGKLRVFRSRIHGNSLELVGKEPQDLELSKEDEEMIKGLSIHPSSYQRLIESVAPAIHGFETQKEAILLQSVGSPRQTLADGTTLRGDLNVLLVGDPGTAKSEILKYASRIAPRGLYTSGRGSTAAGLTAAVVREKSGLMMLEAGAVVLADLGVAAIDEFDKMRPEDRSALHECMEQQTVSVAKGGIVATLNSRTSILAACNPVLGKYDPYRNIADNLNLPIPLLTRFDLIFVIRDTPERGRDEQLAKHVLTLHRKGEYITSPPVDYDTLRKYLAYAKRVNPILTKEAEERLLDYYLQMRSSGAEDMITVTPRQLEALIRLATARARLQLSDKVTEDDALRAISMVQRMLETVGIDVKTGKVDPGVMFGRPLSEKNMLGTALDVFRNLEGIDKREVEGRVFVEELVKTGEFSQEEAHRMLTQFSRAGAIYEVKPGFYKKL